MAAQRDWFDKDFYRTLGVGESATDKEITKAYRKLARELHDGGCSRREGCLHVTLALQLDIRDVGRSAPDLGCEPGQFATQRWRNPASI